MIRKLLKYDIRALYKVILFISVTAVVAAVVGGLGLNQMILLGDVDHDSYEGYEFAMTVSGCTFFFSVVAIIAVSVAITVLVFSRFYKNLYS